MNIIVVSNRLSKAVTLDARHLVVVAALALFAVLGMVSAASWATYTLTRQFGWHLPTLSGSAAANQKEIDALAVKLGEIQAKLVQLDGLTERVADKSGVDPRPFLSGEKSPRGGAMLPGRPFNVHELAAEIGQTARRLDDRTDQLNLIDSLLLEKRIMSWRAPSELPMPSGVQSSHFGWRIDPFNGRQTFHEGIDFIGDVGAPIQAAAPGTVVTAEYHPEYGNIVEIDHGNGFTSRYAHASKLLVKKGDLIAAGQQVSLMGSTGRSTGPHLHFEIRYKGVPQNPLHFLQMAGTQTIASR